MCDFLMDGMSLREDNVVTARMYVANFGMPKITKFCKQIMAKIWAHNVLVKDF